MSDTIASIATPPGEGGISVIRISGPQALSFVANLFQSSQDLNVRNLVPHKVYFGKILDPASQACVDEVLLTYFKAPKSYTAEDVVEVSLHGGLFVTGKVLQLVLDEGARLAEPGEFTRRAFLNGRIDLSQAEAVTDVIHASSERALQSAVAQLQGSLSKKLNGWFEGLLAVLAQLEASIDFSEEGLKFQKREETFEDVKRIRTDLEALIETYRQGKIFREGAKVALMGKPNVGKSSLLNVFLKQDRAIVTPLPGTTRDTLEEKVRIRDIHVNIIDAAGIREHPEMIEKQGIDRARQALKQADLVLVIFDGSQTLDSNDDLLIEEVRDKPKLIVLNKCDLPGGMDESLLHNLFPNEEPLKISAIHETGVSELLEAIYQFVIGEGALQETLVITRERHRQNLVAANEALQKSCDSFQQNLSEEFIAVDVSIAMDHIGTVLGKTFEDDLLDKIFGEFCIGK